MGFARKTRNPNDIVITRLYYYCGCKPSLMTTLFKKNIMYISRGFRVSFYRPETFLILFLYTRPFRFHIEFKSLFCRNNNSHRNFLVTLIELPSLEPSILIHLYR